MICSFFARIRGIAPVALMMSAAAHVDCTFTRVHTHNERDNTIAMTSTVSSVSAVRGIDLSNDSFYFRVDADFAREKRGKSEGISAEE